MSLGYSSFVGRLVTCVFSISPFVDVESKARETKLGFAVNVEQQEAPSRSATSASMTVTQYYQKGEVDGKYNNTI